MAEFTCKECDREFSGQQALDDHNRSKHYTGEKKPVGSIFKNKYLWIFIGIVVIVIVFYSIPSVEPSTVYDDFAQCLTDSGAKMFGAYWCPHCLEQKESFEGSWNKVNYIECSLANNAGQTQICKDERIKGYPTWEFGDGTRMSGFIS